MKTRGQESSSGNAEKKRKVDNADDNVLDLTEIKTDEDARSFEPSSKQSKKKADAGRPDKKNGKRPDAIDLDTIPDRPQTIEIDSDDDMSSLFEVDELALHEYVGSFHTKVRKLGKMLYSTDQDNRLSAYSIIEERLLLEKW